MRDGAKKKGIWAYGLLKCGVFGALICLERAFPLRPIREESNRHDARNLLIASSSMLIRKLIEGQITDRLIYKLSRRHYGLVHRFHMHSLLRSSLAFALLDYTVYLGHRLTHKVPILWRFHQVHHMDLDISTSTAFRIHCGEAILSSIFRSMQVAAIGPSIKVYRVWQSFSYMALLFHHSNLKLPFRLERGLAYFLITPHLHSIHHSFIASEMNSNWSSGLSVWDLLHGSFRSDLSADEIVFGVRGLSSPSQVGVSRLLIQPFLAS